MSISGRVALMWHSWTSCCQCKGRGPREWREVLIDDRVHKRRRKPGVEGRHSGAHVLNSRQNFLCVWTSPQPRTQCRHRNVFYVASSKGGEFDRLVPTLRCLRSVLLFKEEQNLLDEQRVSMQRVGTFSDDEWADTLNKKKAGMCRFEFSFS